MLRLEHPFLLFIPLFFKNIFSVENLREEII